MWLEFNIGREQTSGSAGVGRIDCRAIVRRAFGYDAHRNCKMVAYQLTINAGGGFHPKPGRKSPCVGNGKSLYACANQFSLRFRLNLPRCKLSRKTSVLPKPISKSQSTSPKEFFGNKCRWVILCPKVMLLDQQSEKLVQIPLSLMSPSD